MIVRILGEGQYDLSDDAARRAQRPRRRSRGRRRGRRRGGVRAPRWPRCSTAYARAGVPHDADSLDDSDLILPPADATLAEVRDMLSDDGLIPG